MTRIGNLTPLVAIALTVLFGIAAIGWFAVRILSADDPSPVVSPPPEPVATSWASQTETPVTLNPFELADMSVDTGSPQPQMEWASRLEATSAIGGQVYTYWDNDTTVRVLLQTDLTVQKTSDNTPADVVAMRGGGEHSIVEKQASHGSDAPPVFRSESGGELMTLPGGVLLSLDPNWTEAQVEDFFSDNNIPQSQRSEIGFLPNGFILETAPGFPSLELANVLATQDGVVLSSPNWQRELETR